MPRPPVKRSKLWQQGEKAKRASKTPPTVSSLSAARLNLQIQMDDKQIGHVPSNSDDSDELVTKARNLRSDGRPGRQEVFASGGVAPGDQIAIHQSPTRNSHSNRQMRKSSDSVLIAGTTPLAMSKSKQGSKRADHPSADHPSAPNHATMSRPAATGPPQMSHRASSSAKPTRSRKPPSPVVETSVLGTVKMRKRQPSILQLIDGQDSSLLDDDLDTFLLLDESIPLDGSRKRKLSSPQAPSSPPASTKSSAQNNAVNDSLDAHLRDGNRPASILQPTSEQPDSDTMAPPLSSSTVASPAKAPSPIVPSRRMRKTKSQKETALSTSALQAFMPARPSQRPRRKRTTQARGVFDIPHDQDMDFDIHLDREVYDTRYEADSSFNAPSKERRRKSQSKQPTSRLHKTKRPPKAQLNGKELSRANNRATVIKAKNPGRTIGRGSKGMSQPRAIAKAKKPSTLLPSPSSPSSGRNSPSTEFVVPNLSSSQPLSSAAKRFPQPDQSRRTNRQMASNVNPPTIPPRKRKYSFNNNNNNNAAAKRDKGKDRNNISEQYENDKDKDKENELSYSSTNYSDTDTAINRPQVIEPSSPSAPSTPTFATKQARRKSAKVSTKHGKTHHGRENGNVNTDQSKALRAERELLERQFREVDEWEMEFEDVVVEEGDSL